jgi:hypothetical protein
MGTGKNARIAKGNDSAKLNRHKVKIRRNALDAPDAVLITFKPGAKIRKTEDGKPILPDCTQVASLRPVRTKAAKSDAYFTAPTYGDSTAVRGATRMSVVLGPSAGNPTNYGSGPDPNTPTVMRGLLDGEHNGHGWIAGHLLNDNLGGPGKRWNLTPLTTAGNKNHLNGCEARIKNLLYSAFSRTLYNKSDQYWFGVDYTVRVSDEKWDDTHPHLMHVATMLIVSAKVVKKDKATGAVTDVTADGASVVY